MEDMWAHRKPPRPLDWAELSAAPSASAANGDAAAETSGAANGASAQEKEKEVARIQDQRKLSVRDSFDLFVDACVTPRTLASRACAYIRCDCVQRQPSLGPL